jgi:uncharacterized YccA/Bax inhibitor family protein
MKLLTCHVAFVLGDFETAPTKVGVIVSMSCLQTMLTAYTMLHCNFVPHALRRVT